MYFYRVETSLAECFWLEVKTHINFAQPIVKSKKRIYNGDNIIKINSNKDALKKGQRKVDIPVGFSFT